MNGRLLVGDLIDFNGGSKVATELMLNTLSEEVKLKVIILSLNVNRWQNAGYEVKPLYLPAVLSQQERGLGFFAKHGLVYIQLLIWSMLIGRISKILATSGPGVDMALYWFARKKNLALIQIIHGPVACSRSIAKCLKQAKKIFYLRSTFNSLFTCLTSAYSSSVADHVFERSETFANGLDEKNWPTPSKQESPVVFWAASLLKWKGLDLLTQALVPINQHSALPANICYIVPKKTLLETSKITAINNVSWFEEPKDLDRLRAQSSIFVSTSEREPFGLSILESLAAGLCVIIPADGAYWDEKLKHRINCLKYRPGDIESLTKQLESAARDDGLRKSIADNGKRVALNYGAGLCYRSIRQAIESEYTESAHMEERDA